MAWKILLSVLVVVLAGVPGGASVAACTRADGKGAIVNLTVKVALIAPGGAPGPSAVTDGPGTPGAAPAGSAPQAGAAPLEPVEGVEVRAIAPGASATAAPEAAGVTDAYGLVVLDLSAGPHLVFVQRADPPGTGPLGATPMRAMPDGTLVPMWAAVDLSDGQPASITLTTVQLNP